MPKVGGSPTEFQAGRLVTTHVLTKDGPRQSTQLQDSPSHIPTDSPSADFSRETSPESLILPSLYSQKVEHTQCLQRVIDFRQQNTLLVAEEFAKYKKYMHQERSNRVFESLRMDYEDARSNEYNVWLTATCQQTSQDAQKARKELAS